MWNELGIAATTDLKQIRRAYAARLRAIDPDADPAAFQRLRVAYNRALYAATQPQKHDEPDEEEFEGETITVAVSDVPPEPPAPSGGETITVSPPDKPVEAPPPDSPPAQPAPESEDDRERRQLHEDITALLKAGDVPAALKRLTSALARGTLRLGEREYVLDGIMNVAVGDKTIPAADYLKLLHEVGWDELPRYGDWFSQTRRTAMARAEAERWYLDLQRLAESSDIRPGASGKPLAWRERTGRAKAAWYLLHGGKRLWLSPDVMPSLTVLFEQYQHYSGWIGQRFSAADMAPLEQRFDRAAKRRKAWEPVRKALAPWRNILIWAAAGIVIAALLVFAIGSANVTPGVVAFVIARVAYAATKRR
ncbi:MAG TPA: hypothetical protein VHZ78_01365 [Rhizomicrobium sp.]|jgi:hypothetical protein|nr:hypothetical protein [Rhizomicrobium sp.]